jgi:hypothetical protein
MALRGWDKSAHQIIRPSDERAPPTHLPDRALACVQCCLLVTEPALLVHDERARHAAAHERACALLREAGLKRDCAHSTLHVEEVRLLR